MTVLDVSAIGLMPPISYSFHFVLFTPPSHLSPSSILSFSLFASFLSLPYLFPFSLRQMCPFAEMGVCPFGDRSEFSAHMTPVVMREHASPAAAVSTSTGTCVSSVTRSASVLSTQSRGKVCVVPCTVLPPHVPLCQLVNSL